MNSRKQTWVLLLLTLSSASMGYSTKLLFTVNADVKELDLDTGNVTVLHDMSSAVFSMAYDYENKYLYIPRYQSSDIIRLRYPSEDNTTFETIVNTSSPVRLIIDQQSEHLYWTEHEPFGRIGRSNFDGTNIVTIVNEHYIWALTIDFKNSWIYYSTIIGVQAIHRIRCDGTERQTIIAYPNQVLSLHLDNDENRLYFMDYDTGDIKSANTNGSSLKNIMSTGSRGTNHDLVVNGDYIYCTNNTEILKLQKNQVSKSEIIHTEYRQIVSVFVYMENGYTEGEDC